MITDMADNVKDHYILSNSLFAVSVNLAVPGLSQLFDFVCGKFQNILFYEPLEITTTGKDIFNMIDNFFMSRIMDRKTVFLYILMV